MKTSAIKILPVVVILIATFFATNAQTNVSGGIYANTTWTKANSPYIVTDTVVVFPGVTLTIEPGVEVRFEDSVRLDIRQARLIAQGTITDSITFTSNSPNPHPGSWSMVRFFFGSSINTFAYCNFKYAYQGIYIYSSGGDTLSFQHCNFSNNNTGIKNDGGRITLVDSCNFVNNLNSGLGTGYGIVRNCNFSYCGTGLSGFAKAYNCTMLYNEYGIVGQDTIVNCNIKYNQYGVNGAIFISNSIIDSNIIEGIGGHLGTIRNCVITNNGIGLYIESSGIQPVTQNRIESNFIGIQSFGIDINIYCNQICNNTGYDYKRYGIGNSKISNNYWCTTDSAIIATHIYDGYDDVSLGITNFMPLDTSQCYLTGCNLSVSVNHITNATCDTCHNGSATANITNGFPSFTYTWNSSPIQTTQTATGLPPGTYTVCAVDANGCTACNSVFIDSTNCSGYSIAAQSASATCSTCGDGKAWVHITGGTAPFSYTWYTMPLQNTDTAVNLPQGTYAVCLNDLYGCVACDTFTVAVGNCSAHFDLYPATVPHQYYAVSRASGVLPLTYIWTWGDGTTDTAAFPSHTYSAAGYYTICLSITDSAGCADTYCNPYYLLKTEDGNTMITVNVYPPSFTSVHNAVPDNMTLYPNPTNSAITLKAANIQGETTLKLFDALGRQVWRQSPAANELAQGVTIDLAQMNEGIYFLNISTENGNRVMKVVRY